MLTDLIAIDPSHTSYYESQYDLLVTALQPYQDLCAKINATYGGTPIAGTEDIAVYIADSTGLDLISPSNFMEAVANDIDPSVTSVTEFVDQLTNKEASVLIYNEQTDTPLTEYVESTATSNQVPIVPITETMPTNMTFESWMYSEYSGLWSALSSR